jgi:hypothetical protein
VHGKNRAAKRIATRPEPRKSLRLCFALLRLGGSMQSAEIIKRKIAFLGGHTVCGGSGCRTNNGQSPPPDRTQSIRGGIPILGVAMLWQCLSLRSGGRIYSNLSKRGVTTHCTSSPFQYPISANRFLKGKYARESPSGANRMNV